MEERLRFVARLLEGEGMTEVCREFGISRKTGYKIFNRFNAEGAGALTDRSRRPARYANLPPPQVETLIVSLKRDKPHWGARKIRELLVHRLPGDLRVPAKSLPTAIRSDSGVPFASPNALSIFQSFPSGGCGSASRSSASSRAILSRMDDTSTCT
jgi:transposase